MEGAGVGEVGVRRVGCVVNQGLISRLQPVKEPNNYESVCSFWWLGLVSSIICVSYAVSFANALSLALSVYSRHRRTCTELGHQKHRMSGVMQVSMSVVKSYLAIGPDGVVEKGSAKG